MVANDSTLRTPGHRHQRLNPKSKTVILAFRPNVEDDVKQATPGYTYKQSGVNLFVTNVIKWGPDSSWDSGRNGDAYRNTAEFHGVSYNRSGAGRWYVGYGLPTTTPLMKDSIANAVTVWRWIEAIDGRRISNSVLGKTTATMLIWPSPSNEFGDGGTVPFRVLRCSVRTTRINDLRYEQDYYIHFHPEHFASDKILLTKKILTHEIGHATGMLHLHPVTIAGRTIMCGYSFENDNPEGRFLTSDSTYSDSSKAHFSLKPYQP